VSVKYGKKLLGKVQRAPAAAQALAAAEAAAAEVLAPGFEEAMAAAEAAERHADPAAALPDDLFSDEPLPAARPPSAAARRACEAEAELEAALAEARSLRAFLEESTLEAAEVALAALQRRRQQRESAAAAAATAAAAPHLLPPMANGHLGQLPLLQQHGAVAALAAAPHDGLTPENECCICMSDVR
jgi:hypothetical protein